MNRVIVFDTETTGLPSKYNAKVSEPDIWPYIVQFSWIVYDIESMDMLKKEDYIIKLKNMSIPPQSTKIHGITNEIMNEKGVDLVQVLAKFYEDLYEADICVAHNMKFDKSMIMVESGRYNIKTDIWENKVEFCTMLYGDAITKLTRLNYQNKRVSKHPKLIELYEKLFNERPSNLHNSLMDVLVCFRCYYKMRYNRDLLKDDDKFGGFDCFN
tara:strand:- start:1985 stop:2623 length:639 start_codon:yes stop_codon:yes gene_type:complete